VKGRARPGGKVHMAKFSLDNKWQKLVSVYDVSKYKELHPDKVTDNLNAVFLCKYSHSKWMKLYAEAKRCEKHYNRSAVDGFSSFVAWVDRIAITNAMDRNTLIRYASRGSHLAKRCRSSMSYRTAARRSEALYFCADLADYASEHGISLPDMPQAAVSFVGISNHDKIKKSNPDIYSRDIYSRIESIDMLLIEHSRKLDKIHSVLEEMNR
jgi:hypothetical protein